MSACSTSNSAYFTKDPDAVLDYAVDWGAAPWLADGDTITSSVWIVPATEGGLVSVNETTTTTKTTIWLSGGVLAAQYDVVNRITTNQGRTEDRTLHFTIQQR